LDGREVLFTTKKKFIISDVTVNLNYQVFVEESIEAQERGCEKGRDITNK
jgi:hypothetical protein